MKHASEEFIQNVKTMSDDELLAAYIAIHTKYDILETQRQDGWNRMTTAIEEQTNMADEMACLNIAVHLVRKLKVPGK